MDRSNFGNYHSFWVANSIIMAAKKDEYPLTNLHLQKLMYFLHGHYLAKTGRRLCKEDFQPWALGPVLESVYHCVRHYGAEPIEEYCVQFDPKSKKFLAYTPTKKDQDLTELIPAFWYKYKSIEDPFALVRLSHEFGGAWHRARRNEELYIKTEDIEQEFSKISLYE